MSITLFDQTSFHQNTNDKTYHSRPRDYPGKSHMQNSDFYVQEEFLTQNWCQTCPESQSVTLLDGYGSPWLMNFCTGGQLIVIAGYLPVADFLNSNFRGHL